MVATIGGQMQGVAVGWELYERTGSPTALGLVGLAQVAAGDPAGDPGGSRGRPVQPQAPAHRRARLARPGLGRPGPAIGGEGPIGLVYVCLVLTGIGQAVNMPARWAILPQLVPRELIASAVTWNSSSWQVASVVGPALGGPGDRPDPRRDVGLRPRRRLLARPSSR